MKDTVRKDTVSFLLKVLALSAGVSVLIKVGGPSLSVARLEGVALNYVAIALITLPSLIVGAFLLFRSRT